MDAVTSGRARMPWPGILIGAATLCLVAAGGLLWWRRGAAVFESLVGSAVAWCF